MLNFSQFFSISLIAIAGGATNVMSAAYEKLLAVWLQYDNQLLQQRDEHLNRPRIH